MLLPLKCFIWGWTQDSPEADLIVSGPLKPEHSEAQAPLPRAGPSAGPALPRGPHASGGVEEFSSFHAVKGGVVVQAAGVTLGRTGPRGLGACEGGH